MESLESDVPELDAEYGFNKDQLLSKVASCTSDGAANATKTSNLVGEAKQTAIDNILSIFNEDSPEVGATCTEYHVLHCANHGLNLLAGHSHSHEEKMHRSFIQALTQITRLQRQFRSKHPPNPPHVGAPAVYRGLLPEHCKKCGHLKQLFGATEKSDDGRTSTSW